MSARGLALTTTGDRAPGQVTLPAGSRAIYPGQGPCRIGRVVKRVINDRVVMFYHLIILDESGGELFVPVEKARAIGVRLLLKKSEIPGLLAHLGTSAKAADNMKLFTSGSPFDLAEIVASLSELSSARSLTLGESGVLGRARRLLISEISEVMGETKTAAGEQVDSALKVRRGGMKAD